ncbi:MAG: ABC transporter permease [Candidatus Lustribacter sp.]|jgi:ABC-type nitrate/sulfonate/bicarbonate transport system permease component
MAAFWSAHRTALTRTAAVVVFLFVWEAAVRWGGVSPLFLSSPSAVTVRLIKVFANGSIWPSLLATANVAAWGAFLAIVVGVPVGMAMGRSKLVRDTLEPFIMAMASAPIVAFLPLLIIWLGIGPTSKIALVFVGSVFVVIVNTESGVRQIDPRLIETARSFTASEFEILINIVVPGALPFMIAGVRLAIARVLIMVVVAEFYAATVGIGYLIFQAGSQYDTTLVFVGVVILAGTGVICNAALRALERHIAPWMHTDIAP